MSNEQKTNEIKTDSQLLNGLEFEIGGKHFLCEVSSIVRVLRAKGKLQAIPHSNSWVAGASQLGTKAIVVIDLRERLGLEPVESNKEPYTLILMNHFQLTIGWMVEKVGELIVFDPEDFESPESDPYSRYGFIAEKEVCLIDLEKLIAETKLHEGSKDDSKAS